MVACDGFWCVLWVSKWGKRKFFLTFGVNKVIQCHSVGSKDSPLPLTPKWTLPRQYDVLMKYPQGLVPGWWCCWTEVRSWGANFINPRVHTQWITRRKSRGTGRMSWCLWALTAFPGDPSLVPSTYIRRLTTACNSSSRGSDIFWPLQVPTHITCT